MFFSRLARSSVLKRAYSSTGAETNMTAREKAIHSKLTAALSPHKLRVVDISGGCGSMYAIDIASKQFEGSTIIKQHRLVNDILKDEIKEMHGIQLRTSAK
ncbi:bola protein [Mycotypha africana]|uniref:bola protein n=1 Tax=Mycotypha africana TaxID=64632 RepID=UPI002301A09D|nr:bola protein [Mycotypha africana]KAI8984317.1 bola protein [Mycotypha africana]